MRSTWLAVTLLTAGCFSEAPSSGGCVDGEVACDCRPDGSCDAELECITSIDKCVPTGCTPGGESCTCVDGACLGDLVCKEGVCMAPDGSTTGTDPSMTGPISDTVADTGPDSATMPLTSASTDPTDPSATDSDPTIPPLDTGTIGETDVMSGSVSTDPTNPTFVTESVSDSDTIAEPCPSCISSAGLGDCDSESDACLSDAGCTAVMQCVVNFGNVDACCMMTNDETSTNAWNALVDCAQMSNCDGNCHPYCGG